MALRAVVVGGGIGGTAAAVALARAGIDVQVYEQAARLTEVGAGVSLAPNGLRMLDRLGVSAGIARLGARHLATQLRLSDGRPASHEPHQFARAGRNVGIHRADLLALLAEQLPPGTVRTGHRCTGLRQDAGGAVVTFASGATATADVVIGADGIHSVLQGLVVAAAEPVFSGVVAYRGLVPRLDACPADAMRMWVGEGKHFLVFPVRAGAAELRRLRPLGHFGPRVLVGAWRSGGARRALRGLGSADRRDHRRDQRPGRQRVRVGDVRPGTVATLERWPADAARRRGAPDAAAPRPGREPGP